MGGSGRLERASLLVRLCGTGNTLCHGWITEHPKEAARLGWLLPKLNAELDPTQEPILTHEWGWVLLDDAGNRIPYVNTDPHCWLTDEEPGSDGPAGGVE